MPKTISRFDYLSIAILHLFKECFNDRDHELINLEEGSGFLYPSSRPKLTQESPEYHLIPKENASGFKPTLRAIADQNSAMSIREHISRDLLEPIRRLIAPPLAGESQRDFDAVERVFREALEGTDESTRKRTQEKTNILLYLSKHYGAIAPYEHRIKTLNAIKRLLERDTQPSKLDPEIKPALDRCYRKIQRREEKQDAQRAFAERLFLPPINWDREPERPGLFDEYNAPMFRKILYAKKKYARQEASLYFNYHHTRVVLTRLSKRDESGKAHYELKVPKLIENITWQNLSEISRGKRLNQPEVALLAKNLIDAVKKLGVKQIAHGDLKAANVMVHPETKSVHIVDFGLARRFSEEPKAPSTLFEKNGKIRTVKKKDVMQYILDGWRKCSKYTCQQIPPWTQTNTENDTETENLAPYTVDQTLNIYPAILLLGQLFRAHAHTFFLASKYTGMFHLNKASEMSMDLLSQWLEIFDSPQAYLGRAHQPTINRLQSTAHVYILFEKLIAETEPSLTPDEKSYVIDHGEDFKNDFTDYPQAIARIEALTQTKQEATGCSHA